MNSNDNPWLHLTLYVTFDVLCYRRTNKSDPLSQLALPADWSIRDYQIDRELSAAVAQIPLSYGGR